jgi:predicted DNA-binding transcriptional regulator AlpA
MDVLTHSPRAASERKQSDKERQRDYLPTKMLLRIDDIAEMVGIARRTLFRLISQGAFPKADKAIGKKIRLWKPETVAAWIDGRAER